MIATRARLRPAALLAIALLVINDRARGAREAGVESADRSGPHRRIADLDTAPAAEW